MRSRVPGTREHLLDDQAWGNISEDLLPWHEYNRSQGGQSEMRLIRDRILRCLWEVASRELTPRQRQVLRLYYQANCTQVQVAEVLGIAQSTVHQHLKGKRRNGKRVGGALRRLQKRIRRQRGMAGSEGQADMLELAASLLEGPISRRHAVQLVTSLLNDEALSDPQQRQHR